MLILGVGNPDRADDAAGLLVARRLRQLGIDAGEHTGDMLGLIEEWSSEEGVILVDSVVTGAVPGRITAWDARKAAIPHDAFLCSTHALGVAEAVELARALGLLPRKLIVYGIEAISFEPGGSLSQEVATAVERLAQDLAASANGKQNQQRRQNSTIVFDSG
jgi:hydrogenase maturation protease